jgi:mycofactocin system glycosyltransferase
MTVPLPCGFGIRLDASAKQLRDDLWFGGSPPRVVRLTDSGLRAWSRLQHGPVTGRTEGLLARRLTDAGLAHPVPAAEPPRGELTVVVPVHDRAAGLDRCLSRLGCGHPVVVVDDGSADPGSVERVACAHGARLVRRETNGGPSAARNTGLASVAGEFVAFVDSDCEPSPGWLDPLLAHLADPLVGAAAPRIVAAAPDTRAGRYTRARGSLDLGPLPARVAPGTRVGYVPTAALVVRRAALLEVAGDGPVFDERLRVGEDVDLVWRLHAAGWRIRYEPAVQVSHREPIGWPALLARRFRYGTSAGELARRHPRAMAPLVLHPWPTVAAVGLLARRPVLAGAGAGAAVLTTARTLHRAGVPTTGLLPATARAVYQTLLGLGRYTTQFAAPLLVAGALLPGQAGRRLAGGSLLLGPPVSAWVGHRTALDPATFVLGSVADDVAYGTGVWVGAVRAHTAVPLRPAVSRRPLRIDTRRSPSS